MSCEYCKHESLAYNHVKDEDGNDLYIRVATPMPFSTTECAFNAEPVISWPKPGVIDWADHEPMLCMTAYDKDGEEVCISVPIRHCPMCGRKLPTRKELDRCDSE